MFPIAIGIPAAVLLALSIMAVWKPAILRGADVHLGDSSAAEPNIDEIREAKHDPSRGAAVFFALRAFRRPGQVARRCYSGSFYLGICRRLLRTLHEVWHVSRRSIWRHVAA